MDAQIPPRAKEELADTDATRYGKMDPDATGYPPTPADANATRYESRNVPVETGHVPSQRAVPRGARHALPRPFGDYELLEEIGKGGMGVVYKARQRVGDSVRFVALKMIQGGHLASLEDVRRFRQEARAAGGLDHPGIVPVYDFGEIEDRYFYTMPLVSGGTLADRVREGPLPHSVAAVVLRQVASAVQYAHERGVVHRDLKPSNILLADPPGNAFPDSPPANSNERTLLANTSYSGTLQPRISDFGLARLGESGLSVTGEALGTPSYMPPEQARGQLKVIGPTSDVYSLGAVLYCLLTGRPPFQSDSRDETMRQVRESDPVPLRQLNPRIPRDLETICLKCLQKDPSRRYTSAKELADDLGRWQAGEFIVARPVGFTERALKWVRRYPLVASLSAAVLLALAAGAAVSSYFAQSYRVAAEQARLDAAEAIHQAAVARAAEKKANDEAEAARQAEAKATQASRKAQEVQKFLTGVFTLADAAGLNSVALSGVRGGSAVRSPRDLLNRASRMLGSGQIEDPEVRATVLDTVGDLYRTLGDYTQAEKLLKEGLELRKRLLPADHLEVATSLHRLGWLRHEQGRFDEAEKLYRQALAIRRRRLPPDHPAVGDSRMHLAWLAALADDLEASQRQMQELLAEREERLGPNNRDTAIIRMGLVAVLLDEEKFLEAGPHLLQVRAHIKRSAGEYQIDQAVEYFQSAVVSQSLARHQDAIRQLDKALSIVNQQLGPRHLYSTLPLFHLGCAYAELNRLDDAEKAFEECLVIAEQYTNLEHPKAILLVEEYAKLLARRGKQEQAEKLYLRVIRVQSGMPSQRFLADVLLRYGEHLYSVGGRPEEAARVLKNALRAYRQNGGERRKFFMRCLNSLGVVLQSVGKSEDAEELYREVLPLIRRRFGSSDYRTAILLTNLASARLDQKKTAEVEKDLLEARRIYLALMGPSLPIPGLPRPRAHVSYAATLLNLSRWYRRSGQLSKSIEHADEIQKHWPQDPANLYLSAWQLARCAAAPAEGNQKTAARAVQVLRLAVNQGFRNAKLLKRDWQDWKRLGRDSELAPLRLQIETGMK